MSESVEDKIAKLLRFAADKRGNEAEAANALALAQKLADANNLELMSINTAEKGRSGPRDDKKLNKGLYQYQRTLYKALAELNHCMIWIDKGTAKGSRYEIRLLGSRLNVTLVRNMADYIEDAANRFVRERMSHVHYFSKEAHLYREGVIDRVVERVQQQRQEEEAERERERREQEARQSHPAAARENAIVLIKDVAAEEEKENWIYLHGQESWDREEARRARLAASIEESRLRREQAAQELAKWEAENPEEAEAKRKAKEAEDQAWWDDYKAKQEKARRQKEARDRRFYEKNGHWPGERRYSKPTKYDSYAYQRGERDGSDVSLATQIGEEEREALK